MSLTGCFDLLGLKEELFWQFPGLLVLKDLNSVYLSTNQVAARALGFQSIDDAVGASDDDSYYEVAKFADEFRRLDKLAFSRNEIKIFEVLKYADGKIWMTIETKKLIFDKNKFPLGILCHAMPIENKNMAKIGLHFIKTQTLNKKKTEIKYGCCILGDEMYGDYHLTHQQSICLFYLLRGKTAKQIGKILNISHRTVETYLTQIKIKFNCYSKSELIDKALEEGFSNVIPTTVCAYWDV